jgi:uncharacterized membrane protein YeaQ/YmgE (transglycosylase-associated protein family)
MAFLYKHPEDFYYICEDETGEVVRGVILALSEKHAEICLRYRYTEDEKLRLKMIPKNLYDRLLDVPVLPPLQVTNGTSYIGGFYRVLASLIYASLSTYIINILGTSLKDSVGDSLVILILSAFIGALLGLHLYRTDSIFEIHSIDDIDE